MESVKGFKGFDKYLKCRDFQYEVGKTYEESYEGLLASIRVIAKEAIEKIRGKHE